MAEEQKTKVYDVKVTAADALKELAALKLKSQELKDEQKALGKVTEENAEQYYKLDSQIKATNQQAQGYQKQVTNSIKLQNAQEASLEKLRTQLSLDNAELTKLGDTMANQGRRKELQERIIATTDALNQQEQALGDYRRNVGNYSTAVADLRNELKVLTDQMVVLASQGDTTSEAYQEMAKRAGELKAAQDTVNQTITQTGQGTENIKALTGAVGMATAAYGLWTAASSVLGTENEKLDETMKKMMTVITALNSLNAISNALAKTNATYRAAQNILQLVGINQTKAETKALAAKNAMVTAGTVGTKLAAAATWLWNAALAANPVVLIVMAVAALTVGILALTGAFKSSSKESEAAAKSMDAYKKSVEDTAEVLKELERAELRRSRENELALSKELEMLRANGATKAELAAAELAAANRQRATESAYAKARIKEREIDYAKAQQAIKDKQAEIDTWTKSNKKLKEAQEELAEMRKEAGLLRDVMLDDAHLIEVNAQATIKANRDANEQIAREALDTWLGMSQRRQKINEDMLKMQNTFATTDIKARQEYERQLFKIQQDGERERLAAQRKAGNITAKEYADQLKLLSIAADAFNNKQLSDMQSYYNAARAEALKLAGQTTDQQIADVTAKYTKALNELADVERPQLIPGMTDAEYQKLLDEYEAFLYTREELEIRLAKEQEKEIQAIRDASLAKRIAEVEEAITKEYKDDFDKFANNEREKLRVLLESLEKQRAAKKAAGLTTYEEDAAIQAAQMSMNALNRERDLVLQGKTAKDRYKIRKKSLEEELALVKGNADEELRVKQEMADNERMLFEERAAKAMEYVAAVGDMMGALNDLLTALDEREMQRIEEKYAKQQEDLDNALRNGTVSQKEYDNRMLKMEKEKAKEEAKIKREQAIRDRVMALFNIAMNTAMGIMNAVSAFWMTGGMPWAAIIGALGAVQIAGVLAAPLPKAARGKYVKGKSHRGGGETIEAEGGEAIINRRSSSMFLPLLSAINEMGGGVPFTTIGADGGYAMRSASAGQPGMTRGDMEAAIYEAMSDVTIIATIEDIRREDALYATIQDRGNI